MELVANSFHTSAIDELAIEQATTEQRIVWTIAGQLPPKFEGTFTYSARQFARSNQIVNPGAHATWIYNGESNSMTSNPVFNPVQKVFLPQISR